MESARLPIPSNSPTAGPISTTPGDYRMNSRQSKDSTSGCAGQICWAYPARGEVTGGNQQTMRRLSHAQPTDWHDCPVNSYALFTAHFFKQPSKSPMKRPQKISKGAFTQCLQWVYG